MIFNNKRQPVFFKKYIYFLKLNLFIFLSFYLDYVINFTKLFFCKMGNYKAISISYYYARSAPPRMQFHARGVDSCIRSMRLAQRMPQATFFALLKNCRVFRIYQNFTFRHSLTGSVSNSALHTSSYIIMTLQNGEYLNEKRKKTIGMVF